MNIYSCIYTKFFKYILIIILNGMEAYIKFLSLPCNRKCPCRTWPQCDRYKDAERKRERLNNKSYDLDEWFSTIFRVDCGMHELYLG